MVGRLQRVHLHGRWTLVLGVHCGLSPGVLLVLGVLRLVLVRRDEPGELSGELRLGLPQLCGVPGGLPPVFVLVLGVLWLVLVRGHQLHLLRAERRLVHVVRRVPLRLPHGLDELLGLLRLVLVRRHQLRVLPAPLTSNICWRSVSPGKHVVA